MHRGKTRSLTSVLVLFVLFVSNIRQAIGQNGYGWCEELGTFSVIVVGNKKEMIVGVFSDRAGIDPIRNKIIEFEVRQKIRHSEINEGKRLHAKWKKREVIDGCWLFRTEIETGFSGYIDVIVCGNVVAKWKSRQERRMKAEIEFCRDCISWAKSDSAELRACIKKAIDVMSWTGKYELLRELWNTKDSVWASFLVRSVFAGCGSEIFLEDLRGAFVGGKLTMNEAAELNRIERNLIIKIMKAIFNERERNRFGGNVRRKETLNKIAILIKQTKKELEEKFRGMRAGAFLRRMLYLLNMHEIDFKCADGEEGRFPALSIYADWEDECTIYKSRRVRIDGEVCLEESNRIYINVRFVRGIEKIKRAIDEKRFAIDLFRIEKCKNGGRRKVENSGLEIEELFEGYHVISVALKERIGGEVYIVIGFGKGDKDVIEGKVRICKRRDEGSSIAAAKLGLKYIDSESSIVRYAARGILINGMVGDLHKERKRCAAEGEEEKERIIERNCPTMMRWWWDIEGLAKDCEWGLGLTNRVYAVGREYLNVVQDRAEGLERAGKEANEEDEVKERLEKLLPMRMARRVKEDLDGVVRTNNR